MLYFPQLFPFPGVKLKCVTLKKRGHLIISIKIALYFCYTKVTLPIMENIYVKNLINFVEIMMYFQF